ncbi:hypothetical protein NL676_007602 [Syzygium grande]|nr:hypothetical protein NL676_007602 [Syzygium grande]
MCIPRSFPLLLPPFDADSASLGASAFWFLSQCFLHALSPSLAAKLSPPLSTPPTTPATPLPSSASSLSSPSTSRSARPPSPTSRTTSAPAGPPRLTPHDAAGTDAKATQAASSAPIPDAEKEQIKALIVPLMLSLSACIQTTHDAIPAVWGGGRGVAAMILAGEGLR